MPKLYSVKTDYAKMTFCYNRLCQNYIQIKQTMPELHSAVMDYAKITFS